MKIEIKKIGNSDGLLLPKELMQRLDLKRGQQLHITELPGGGFQALPYNPDFERTMEIADEIMKKCRDPRGALAKWATKGSRSGSATSRPSRSMPDSCAASAVR